MSGGDWKAMFKGIQENDIELVKYYLRIGIDPNYQHPEYMALPLAESLRYGHFEITEVLLSNGANPTIIEMESGITCQEMGKRMENQQVIDLLNKYVEK
ncbi:MAG: ankyrin repeat domain-containing protein [Bacteroidota bacterium]